MKIVVTQAGGPRLVQDYVAGVPQALQFFGGSHSSLATYRDKLHEVGKRFGRDERVAAAATLRPTTTRAAERLARFVEEGGGVVTTGQQAGLFTGPLYTVHKMLAAVALAETLERALGVVVLPVFWVASEDHDWAEVNHAWLLDRKHGLRRIEAESDEPRAIAMATRQLGEAVERTCVEAAQVLAGSEFSDAYLALIRRAYSPTTTVAGAFRTIVEELGAPFDLLTTDAADPQLKQASRGVLKRALTNWREEDTVLRRDAEQLVDAGYHVQVALPRDSANLFLHTDAGRERLRWVRAGWRTGSAGETMSPDAMLRLADQNPAVLSPNALLRPVVESAVFPVLSYVAGPGEASYFAQIGELFRVHGMRSPVVFPRPSVQWLPEVATAALEQLGIELEELAAPEHELAGRLARRRISPGTMIALESLRGSTVEGFRALLEAAACGDAAAEQALGSIRNRVLAQLAKAEHAIVKHTRRAEADRIQELVRARNVLRPLGAPQERVLNAFAFLVDHGPDLLRRTADAIRSHIEKALA